MTRKIIGVGLYEKITNFNKNPKNIYLKKIYIQVEVNPSFTKIIHS